jgi:hypothetical protein
MKQIVLYLHHSWTITKYFLFGIGAYFELTFQKKIMREKLLFRLK